MKIEPKHIIYFLGIGGIGMSAIARYYNLQGVEIHGYDRTETPLTKQLESEGIYIHYQEDISKIPENTNLVIYTPAVPETNAEFAYCRGKGLPMKKRSMVLGEISQDKYTIAVAGTHGKTSTTSTIAHLMHECGLKFTAFIGGISNNFSSNLVHHPESDIILVEADEFDRSFLQLHPDIAIITSMDADHLDIYHDYKKLYSSFEQFVSQIKDRGHLIKKIGLDIHSKQNTITFGLNEQADYHAKNILKSNNRFFFNLVAHGKIVEHVEIKIPGRYNIENAMAALAVTQLLGIDIKKSIQALTTYRGVKRRFDIRLNSADRIYIDDYAHHPEELKACISAARELNPGKRITGIFQPHLYSRTRDLLDDFADALSLLDELVLLDIYPAREEPIPGIESKTLFEKVKLPSKYLLKNTEVTDFLRQNPPQVLLTLGAGDIDKLVEPIENLLKEL